jgi:hypothetical protein
MAKALYDQDFQAWVETTIQHLKSREFDALDIENLIEELADLGKSERNALVSHLKILLAHLLKLRVQATAPETMKGSWYDSVVEHRQRVLDSLENAPSFKGYLPEAIGKAYGDARKIAIKEGRLARLGVPIPPEGAYPVECPFRVEQILDEDFFGF